MGSTLGWRGWSFCRGLLIGSSTSVEVFKQLIEAAGLLTECPHELVAQPPYCQQHNGQLKEHDKDNTSIPIFLACFFVAFLGPFLGVSRGSYDWFRKGFDASPESPHARTDLASPCCPFRDDAMHNRPAGVLRCKSVDCPLVTRTSSAVLADSNGPLHRQPQLDDDSRGHIVVVAVKTEVKVA